ncbi:MAG TPA: DUF5312 family protein [Spirochaetota bacterium]|nr:DUF5312 family protein [Spirochaetota bacterium]HOL57834.1 DUF5312 family protein [Spirochaetota bacterium]HPP05416.1 DUF5312 family protein [Spirochaetota bacterium]
MNIFTYLKHLITGDTEGLLKLRELNLIYKQFKSSKYKFITKDKTLTQLFLNKIYSLYINVLSFKPLLEATIFNSDEKRAQLFLAYLIESNAPSEIVKKKEKFAKEYIWQKIVESDNPNKLIKDIEEEFKMYRNYFTKYNMPKFEAEYQMLYKLYNLATFNFEQFFSKFDPSFSPSSGMAPNYAPVNGMDLLNELKDLYFLIASLPQKVDVTNSLNRLNNRINEENAKNLTKSQITAINNIYKMISDELSSDRLFNLCKFISEDLKLKIPVEFKQVSILDKFRKEIEERFLKTKDMVLEKYSEQSLLADIRALFKNKELLKINGYTDELMNSLEANNFDAISGIQAFRITKTFLFENYEHEIKEVINTLILESFFNEKEYQTEFSNVFFAVNEFKDNFSSQEELIANSPSYSFRVLQTFLLKSSNSNDAKVKKIIEVINEKIYNINKKSGELFYALGNKIYEVLQDYKSQKPVRISNIKTIRGVQNREFINQLLQGYNDIAKYIKIIKNFVTIGTKK